MPDETPTADLAALAAKAISAPLVTHIYTADPSAHALKLAELKAVAVAADHPRSLVIGCDSVLELDGEILGKPVDAADARERWYRMRGRSGVLHTGHWLIDARPGDGTGAALGETASTTVWFADASDEEIDAYVATEEPLRVAGAFTVDGLGGPFVERIDGDYHTVVGLSLPLLRRLLAALGVPITSLWVA